MRGQRASINLSRPDGRSCPQSAPQGSEHGVTGVLALRPMTEAGLPLANAYNDRS